VPDTMDVSMQHPEEILFTWNSGFGNNQYGVTEDVLGADGSISRGQQIRYSPQKVNRPDGTEMLGQTATPKNAHMQNFLDFHPFRRPAQLPLRPGLQAFPSPAGWRVSRLSRGPHRALGSG